MNAYSNTPTPFVRRAFTVLLVVLMALFAFSSPYFLTLRNLTNIVTQNT